MARVTPPQRELGEKCSTKPRFPLPDQVIVSRYILKTRVLSGHARFVRSSFDGSCPPGASCSDTRGHSPPPPNGGRILGQASSDFLGGIDMTFRARSPFHSPLTCGAALLAAALLVSACAAQTVPPAASSIFPPVGLVRGQLPASTCRRRGRRAMPRSVSPTPPAPR